MMIKLGVDNGNYNTKSSEGMLYASGYAASDKEFITPEMQLFYEGRYYAIGEKRVRFQQDKTKEPDAFLLTLPAIASAMKKAGVSDADILLGVGLPIEAYGAQKEAFRQYFLPVRWSFVLRVRSTGAVSLTAKFSRRGTPRCAATTPSSVNTAASRLWTSEATRWMC